MRGNPLIWFLLAVFYLINPILAEDIWYWTSEDRKEFSQPNYPCLDWDIVKVGAKFKMKEGEFGWLKAWVRIPEKIDEQSVKGLPVAMFVSTSEGGEIYVDGKLQARYDNDHPGAALLSKHAVPGEVHTLAIRVFGPVMGEREVVFEQAELKIIPFEKANKPCLIRINPRNIQGILPRPLAGISQGGGMADYEPDTALALKDLKPLWFRMDNVLTSVVREENGKLVYDWTDFDRRIDFIFQTGAEPIICLSYMPIPFDAIPDPDRHSAPKDYTLWEDLCYKAAKHCIERGKRVRYWEVWNEANAGWLKPPPGITPLEAYLKLYEASVKGIKKADPNALVGGPCNASGPWDYSEERPYCINGETYMEGLLKFCNEKGLPLDFITWHEYFHPPEVYIEEMEKTKAILAKYPRIERRIKGFFLTEFNYAWWPDFAQDNEVGSAWVANNIIRASIPAGITGVCFFYAKDGDKRFRGSWGMLIGDNIPKPSYFVFKLFSMMEKDRVETLGGDDEICALASISPGSSRLTILVVNFAERYGIPRLVKIVIEQLPATLRGGISRLFLIDPEHNNVFHNPSVRKLECTREGKIPLKSRWEINLNLLPNSVALIELSEKEFGRKNFRNQRDALRR